MPDHFHMLANPLRLDISVVAGRLKGRAAALILAWLRDDEHVISLAKLELARPLKSGQTHAVWQQDFSAVDVWSRKFIRQKLNYVYNNPVRAGLVDHPGKWRWLSYRAYFAHQSGEVPIEVDQRWLWTEEELKAAGVEVDDRRRGAGQVWDLNGKQEQAAQVRHLNGSNY